MPPVVVEVVQRLAPGGIEVMVLELQRLLAADVDLHVVSLEGTAAGLARRWSRIATLGDRLHALAKPPGRDGATLVRLCRLFARLAPQAVHTHHIGPLLYGGLAARLTGVRRLVHTEHDAWHLARPGRRRLLRAALAVLRPVLVADAGPVAAQLRRHVPTSRPRIIVNGIDTERFSPGDPGEARRRLGLPPDRPLIGSAGRLEPVKGHAVLLAAFRRLPADTVLAIAGAGSCRAALQAAAADAAIAGRVLFLGHVADMACFYRALDVFCLPSLAEGLPLALLEAQACGVPAVVTAVGAMADAAAPGVSRVVPAGDSGGLARALADLLAERRTGDPRAFVIEGHDARRMAAAYRTLLAA
jgi:glycosyltransferase involved in cell wall biosynthesis